MRGPTLSTPAAGRVLLAILLVGLAAPARPHLRLGHAAAEDGSGAPDPVIDLQVEPGLRAARERVLRVLPFIVSDIEHRLGLSAGERRVEIRIVAGEAGMRAAAGAETPRWAAGVFVPAQERIVVRLDLADGSRPLRTLEQVLKHEWVHLAWARTAGARHDLLPHWVEEGLAETLGGGVSVDAGATLDLAAWRDRLLDFRALETDWPRADKHAALAYAQSASFVAFLQARVTRDVWRRVLARLLSSTSTGVGALEDAVYAETKRPLNLWIEDWRAEVKRQADPWFHLLLRDFWGSLFLVLALASAVAYFVLRRRRRQEMEALPDEPTSGAEA